MKLVIDFETRSRVDLKKCGVYVYAADPSTDILCMAVKVKGSSEKFIWVPEKFMSLLGSVRYDKLCFDALIIDDKTLNRLITETKEIHAHNAQFERTMWRYVMCRYGFPEVPFEKWRCTAAKAAYYALPRKLEDACKVLGLPDKDKEGSRIMLKMCKPNNKGQWHENPEDFARLCSYCVQDIVCEEALDNALYDIPESELKVWQADQRINDRGIKVDISAINNLKHKIEFREKQMLSEVFTLTNGAIKSPRQRDALLDWFAEQGLVLSDARKNTIAKALELNVNEQVKTVLEIRQELAKSSVKKLDAMKRMACDDDRVRGTILYHGASTGRFSGKGIQPQNYPRDSYDALDIMKILSYGVDDVESEFDSVMKAASKCLRGMLIAEQGKQLFCADFKSIEAVVLAWIAGEISVVDSFAKGLDLYKVAASAIYHKSYIDITPEERQVGKVAVLALGYQGWTSAFRSMAAAYGVKVPEKNRPVAIQNAKRAKAIDIIKSYGKPITEDNIGKVLAHGVEVTEDEIFDAWAKPIILNWREARPATTAFWAGVESAAIQAVQTGKCFSYGRIKFGIRGDFLHCRIPSGRILSYYKPEIESITTKYGVEKNVITYYSVNDKGKWARLSTYGGKLVENIVQAIARDIMVEAMLRVEQAGYPVVIHVHDEIVSEADENADLSEFEKLMQVVPDWATGCPIGAKGWKDSRYKKD